MPQPTRNLAFRDRWLKYLTEIVDESIDPDALASFPDMTTPTTLSTTWTQEQYTKILSSIEVGAALAFPELRQQIYYDFLIMTNGGGMSCEDVADCIETSEDVLNALLQKLADNGYYSNQINESPTNVTISPSKSAENLLPDDYDCTESQLMATARGIVKNLHESAEDFFDAVEFSTNPMEFGNVATDGVPVVGTLNNTTEMIDWMVQTVREAYQASYNQEVENEIACAIFCEILPDCEVSYDNLLSAYADFVLPDYGLPDDVSDFQSVADWAMGLSLAYTASTVATFHYVLLLAMKFGSGTVFNLAGLGSMKNIIAQTVGLSDSSWTECDCAPTETPDTYWELKLEFALSQYGVRLVGSSAYLNGGIEGYHTGSVTIADFTIDDLGGGLAYRIAKVRMRSLRRGSVGNGVNDYKQLRTATGVGYTGTLATVWTVSNITCNTNDCSNSSGVLADGTPTTKAVRFLESVDGVTANDKVNVYEVTLYGYNHDDNKPTGAIWVAAIP